MLRLFFALVLGTSAVAHAGGRSTKIGVVNLDQAPKAKRFGYVVQGLERATQGGGVIDGVIVIPRATVARHLRPDCGLTMPWDAWQKLEQPDVFLDYVVLYCADAARQTVTWNVFDQASATPFMSVTVRPTSNSIGRPAVTSLARAIVEVARMRFSP